MRKKSTGAIRELDILITDLEDPERKILVECRDRRRRQDVTWIDELDGKARGLGFKSVIAISSAGFTKTAEREAAERGIRTLHLREAEKKDWQTWRWGIESLGLNVLSSPVIRQVRFHSSDPAAGTLLKNAKRRELIFLNQRTQERMLLNDYLRSVLSKPVVKKALQDLQPNAINHFTYSEPVDPGVGIVRDSRFIQLTSVEVMIDVETRRDDVPMKHFRLGETEVLSGESSLTGSTVKVIVIPDKDSVKIMIEGQGT